MWRPPILLILLLLVLVALGMLYALAAAARFVSDLAARHTSPLWFMGRPELWTAAGALVAIIGFPFANRFRRPTRFRSGVLAIAVGLIAFWPLQGLVGLYEFPYWEYAAFVHGVAAFVSLCLVSGGLEAIRRSSDTPEQDTWEFLN